METTQHQSLDTRAAIRWGIAVGAVNAALPAMIWWLDVATVHSMTIALIASVYIGFAVADGRPRVIAVECAVALLFVVIAATAVTGSEWLLVAGHFGHGCKDLWQHRTHFVSGTRWWPPFCMAVDWVVAGSLVALIVAGVQFR
jgi:hypothetical protein